MTTSQLTEMQQSSLSGLLSAATAAASQAMQQWTGQSVCLTLDSLLELTLEEAAESLNVDDEPLSMVVLGIDEKYGGQLILAFGEQESESLAYTLVGVEDSSTPEGAELKQSALMETGNILGCAYVNAISTAVDLALVPTPPCFVQDFGCSVLGQALVQQTMSGDNAIVCHTRFTCDDEELHWNVFFLPTRELQKELKDSLQTA
ncbi:MAG: chemotaxis protein [Pirellulales bacterium]|nr:chemotaxis protein [Pirellulales bacterium]